MSLLDELLVGLGFEYDPSEVKQFKKDIGDTVDTIKVLARVAVAGATAITGLTIASTKATDEQGKLANEIDSTVEEIDALQFALQRAGGTSNGMSTSLQQLSIRASEAARGVGSGIEAFGLLGISTTDVNGKLKSTTGLLIEVSKQFVGLEKGKQIELAEKLGLRDSIRLLQQGPDAIQGLIQEAKALGITTGEDAAIAEEFQDSLVDLWQIIKQTSRTLSRIFAPILKEMVGTFTDWWKINKDLIEQNLPKWIDQFTHAFKMLSIAVAGFLAFKLIGNLGMLITMLKGVTLATLRASAAAILLPFLIGAGIVGFIALVEDAKVFFEGGESVIGDMIKRFPEWENAITNVASILGGVYSLTMMIFDGWSQLLNLDFKQFAKDLPGFLDYATGSDTSVFEKTFQNMSNFIEGISTGISNLQSTNNVNPTIPSLGNVNSMSNITSIDKLEIVVQGGADTAENIARTTFNIFQQTSQDLNSAVDQ